MTTDITSTEQSATATHELPTTNASAISQTAASQTAASQTAVNQTRAGFVAIIGEPNVGKSTLMNAIMGTKLSIVTPKPQTTRKSILGIYSDEAAAPPVQIVFYDTPGLLKPSYGLHKSMMEFVRVSVEGADVLLVVLDALQMVERAEADTRKISRRGNRKDNRKDNGKDSRSGASTSAATNEQASATVLKTVTDRLRMSFEAVGKPVYVAINKMDALPDPKRILPVMDALLKTGVVREVFTISALENKYVSDVLAALTREMPEHEFYYDPELLSEMPQRFFVSEIIREAVFLGYKDEIPYSCEVNIAEFKEREHGKWYIAAEIVVERDTQKAIIIGKQGTKLKETGSKARVAIEDYLELPVFLELFVKVREDWRDSPTFLRSFGYGVE
jgi:GTPase